MTPKELLEKLKESSSERVCASLNAIYEICEEQLERGVDDFSYSSIARLGYSRGVPKAQSIRNKGGEKYRTLIKTFSEQKNFSKKKTTANTTDQWIEEIENPKHKLLVKILSSKLREANQKLDAFIPPGSVIEVIDKNNFYIGDEYRLTEQERKALEYLISERFLNKWNFKKSEFGEVLDQQHKVVFQVATIDALQKALRYL